MNEILAHGETGSGSPLVILHGLLGSQSNWASFARRASRSRKVFTLDLRNHGDSPWSSVMTYAAMADDVARFMIERDLAPADVIGHSMGGKTAMQLALSRGELVRRLTIVDIAPVVYGHGMAGPYAKAMREIDPADHDSRGSVDAELAKSVDDPAMRAFLMKNLARSGSGFAWTVNLRAIVDSLDDLFGFPETDARFDGPTLVVAGGRSDYVLAEHEDEIVKAFPKARIERIDDAGHWAHAENPSAFERAVGPFLEIDFPD